MCCKDRGKKGREGRTEPARNPQKKAKKILERRQEENRRDGQPVRGLTFLSVWFPTGGC